MKYDIKSQLIVDYMKTNCLTRQQFCKKYNISSGVLNKILKKQTNFRIGALFKIADILNVQASDLFEK